MLSKLYSLRKERHTYVCHLTKNYKKINQKNLINLKKLTSNFGGENLDEKFIIYLF